MTNIINTIHKIPQRIMKSFVLLAIIIVCYFGFLLVVSHPALEPFSMLPYWMCVALIGVTLMKAVDDFVLTEINTYNLLKRNPIGYALYLLGYAIIIAACLAQA